MSALAHTGDSCAEVLNIGTRRRRAERAYVRRSALAAAQNDGRVIPSFRIFDWSVVRFRPSFAAAPSGPPITPRDFPQAP